MKIKNNLCKVKDCEKQVHVVKHMLCRGHYNRLTRDGFIKNKPLRIYEKREATFEK